MPLQRFGLTITSRTLVKALSPPPDFPEILPVSNLDLILGSFPIYLITILPSTSTATFAAAIAAIRANLPTFLSHFYPFAGRIATNPTTSLPEIYCDNSGAELVVAEATIPLADIDFPDADGCLGVIAIPFELGLPLSLQAVRFACGGYSLSWGTNHLLVDGHGLTTLPNSWCELLLTGHLLLPPRHDRSLFRPRSPTRFDHLLDREFTRYAPSNLINTLLAPAGLVRRLYRVDASDIERLQAAATRPGARSVSRFLSFCAYVWKLLAAAVGDSDRNCRMAWLVDGRKAMGMQHDNYLGNVVTYASREASVDEILRSPLADVAAMARAAIAEVSNAERFRGLVDWMEMRKDGFKDGGKWTEMVGMGLGSPAMVMTALLPFKIEGDFGFGKPNLVMPWMRPGRLGSAHMVLVRSATGDGSWLVSTRMWPRLVQVVEADPDSVLKPATAVSLGFAGPAAAQISRL